MASEELLRGQLHIELQTLQQHEELIGQVETRLQMLAKRDDRVQRLQTIPGVGPRLAEVVVATIDDPKRFKNAKQVGAYARRPVVGPCRPQSVAPFFEKLGI